MKYLEHSMQKRDLNGNFEVIQTFLRVGFFNPEKKSFPKLIENRKMAKSKKKILVISPHDEIFQFCGHLTIFRAERGEKRMTN